MFTGYSSILEGSFSELKSALYIVPIIRSSPLPELAEMSLLIPLGSQMAISP
ncbi:MAG: hypothetical protein LBT88_07150 [Oscillospiraceae bacterium]|nr:hypothetical protein [Oscillospiraceae bacterium]